MKLKKLNLFLAFFVIIIFISLIQADTTFFDNPDDAFIMGDSRAIATGEVSGGATGGATGGVDCVYKWNCTDWGECFSSGEQIRKCVNIGNCHDTYRTPKVERNCTYAVSGGEEELGEENIIEEDRGKEFGKMERVYWQGFLVFFVVVLVILFIVFYLKRNYFKKLIKKSF